MVSSSESFFWYSLDWILPHILMLSPTLKLEENLAAFPSVTKVLDEGKSPEEMLQILLDGMDMEITDTMPVRFYCNCDKNRVEKAIISIGEKEIKEMVEEGKEIEVKCHFCNKGYNFSVEELKTLLRKAKR